MSDSPATPRSTAHPAASLLPSWPQLPRPAYAVAPIAATSTRTSSSRSAPSISLRSSNYERSAPYPSSRPARAELVQASLSQSTSTMHEVELHRTREALQSHLAQRQRSSSSRQPPPQQTRTTSSNSHPSSSNTTSNAQSSSKEAQHKVYLLNCKHCGNFLSDRGMKAVLLLKPNITLYSTDIVPSTCGPFFGGSSFHGGIDANEPPVERTCQCLTQSLGCYGCGAQVGYNIISPCARCTSSVMKHSRSSNGHRTVLHCSEIGVRERRYIPGEPGVRAQPAPCAQVHLSPPAHADPMFDEHLGHSSQLDLFRHSNVSRRDVYRLQFGLDEDDVEAEKAEINAGLHYQHHPQQPMHRDPRVSDYVHAHDANAARSSSAPFSSASKRGRVLKRGDTLYWSDLVAGGERAQPFDPDPILERPIVGR